ncbi:hypothetical protein [Caballeronia fortuita]|uniref:hypothetical protein n=1 Tax=Caballeronia fortuita TaxID=1777138 RepID=UPI0012FDF16E|nr:hypothetical protein [Caballeronia fortuita]
MFIQTDRETSLAACCPKTAIQDQEEEKMRGSGSYEESSFGEVRVTSSTTDSAAALVSEVAIRPSERQKGFGDTKGGWRRGL